MLKIYFEILFDIKSLLIFYSKWNKFEIFLLFKSISSICCSKFHMQIDKFS